MRRLIFPFRSAHRGLRATTTGAGAWLLALAIGVAGCHGTPAWTKAGASPETVRDAYGECQREADRAVARDRDIETDILATRSNDWRNTGTLQAKKETFALQDRGREQDIVASCMRSKGYVPAS